MCRLLQQRFLPTDYEETTLFVQYQQCKHGNRSLSEYFNEFHRLAARNNFESEEKLAAKFVGGLKEKIQYKMAINTQYSSIANFLFIHAEHFCNLTLILET